MGLGVLLLAARPVAAQITPPADFPLKDGLKTYLSKDSTTFLRLNFVAQTWVRLNENNPGSTVNGELASSTGDVGLRRVRLVLSGQLTKRVFVYVQFGQNSFSYLSPRKTGSFFHDVTGEYAIVKRALSLGVGLNGWNGPGRYSNSAASSILGLDPPVFQEATNDVNDQLLRQLGVYAKGKLGKLDYRMAIGKPFVTQTATATPDPLSHNSTYTVGNPRAQYHGYFMYQFLDQESNAGAGTVGSYVGRKRVFNIGAGMLYEPQGVWHTTLAGDTVRQALQLFGVDVFYDAPLNPAKGTALTAYGGFFHYDFGPGYLRNNGVMNPANGVRPGQGSFNGPGNSYPLLGTGNIVYAQAGYLLKRNLLGEHGTLQPYASTQVARYDRLADPLVVANFGINWLIVGNSSKVTANYQSRPIYTAQPNGDLAATGRRGEYVLQYQVAF
ncbi:hypothetical protein J4D99_00650 [Siccationidurans ginsengisoli]|nr:hypothetical protein [Hymenobacter sp. BT559]